MGARFAALLRVYMGLGVLLGLYVLVQTILRFFLYLSVTSEIQEGPLLLLQSFVVGALYDTATFFLFWTPYFFYEILVSGFSRRSRRFTSAYGVAFIIFTMGFLVVDYLYWLDFSRRITFYAWDYFAYPREVLGHITEVYPAKLTILILIMVAVWLYRKLSGPHFRRFFPESTGIQKRWGAGTALLIAGCFLTLLSQRQAERNVNQFLNELSKNGCYSFCAAGLHFHMNFRSYFDEIEESEVGEIMKESLADPGVQFASDERMDHTRIVQNEGAEKQYNVIMVVMESMSWEFMERGGNKKRLTPNLDRIASEGVFFSNFYASGTRTVRGLEVLSLSMPPGPGPSVIKERGNGNLYSLGFLFQDRDYDTAFIYSGRAEFDNMHYFFMHNGFRVVDRRQFLDESVAFGNVWGVSDEDLFSCVLKEADKSLSEDKPFFYMAMTTSNHPPYTIPTGRVSTEGLNQEEAAVRYADWAIGQLMEQASSKDWFDNTLFVFVSDHAAHSFGNREISKDKYRIPFIVYNPHFVEAREFDRLGCQVDVAPTIASFLNLSYISKFYGHDLTQDYPKPYALLGCFDRLGYLDEGGLCVLKPWGGVRIYDLAGNVLPYTDSSDVLRAKALYQHSSDWRRRQKRINTRL